MSGIRFHFTSMVVFFSRFDNVLPSGLTLVALTESNILALRPPTLIPPTALLRRLMKIAELSAAERAPNQPPGERKPEQDLVAETKAEATTTKNEENKGFLTAPLMNLGMDMGNWAWLKGPMFSPRKPKPDDSRPAKTPKDVASETTHPENAAIQGLTRQVGAGAD